MRLVAVDVVEETSVPMRVGLSGTAAAGSAATGVAAGTAAAHRHRLAPGLRRPRCRGHSAAVTSPSQRRGRRRSSERTCRRH
eukprot:9132856-Pyramimonas_sp.AAC.1